MKDKEEVLLKLSNNQKIHLQFSLISDFNALSSKAINSGSDAGGDVQLWLDKKNSLIGNLRTSLVDQQKVIDFGNKLKQSFKEIGVDVPANVNKEIDGAIQWQKEINGIISKLNSFNIK